MKNTEFPNYFQASDSISINSQSNYLQLIRVDLISMIVASALAIYNFWLTFIIKFSPNYYFKK